MEVVANVDKPDKYAPERPPSAYVIFSNRKIYLRLI